MLTFTPRIALPWRTQHQAAQQAGHEAVTRTEGRASGGSTYRLRRQQMRVELREANAARRLRALCSWSGDQLLWLGA
jgi:hypothetical protein